MAWLDCGWPSAPKVAGLTPSQVGGFSCCRESTAAISYDYMACKRSLECMSGLVVPYKTDSCTGSHRQRSGAYGMGVKITCDVSIYLYGATLKRDTSLLIMH
ncbi:hypothetical protein TNCV_3209951 [Trichonephila clavipes]|nr:hypothetical protein TNCV_3209951 [Trichonephila clavipes]